MDILVKKGEDDSKVELTIGEIFMNLQHFENMLRLERLLLVCGEGRRQLYDISDFSTVELFISQISFHEAA